MATDKLAVGCYLVMHPRGTLIWDTGAVAGCDGGRRGRHRSAAPPRPAGWRRNETSRIAKPLKAQLRRGGICGRPTSPTSALSHYHYDHSAQHQRFRRRHLAGACRSSATRCLPQNRRTWYSRAPTRRCAAARRRSSTPTSTTCSAIAAVLIRFAPGHTPGHQVLYVKLARTGGVVLSGDLYHYPEERTLNRDPGVRRQPGSDGGDAAGARRVPEAEQSAVVDPARFHGERQAEEGAGDYLQVAGDRSEDRPLHHVCRARPPGPLGRAS